MSEKPAQVLFQTGWRFSAKAVAPSIAPPLANASLASSFVRCQPAASSSSAASAPADGRGAPRSGSWPRSARPARGRCRPPRRGARPGSPGRAARAVGIDRVARHRELERDRERQALRQPDQSRRRPPSAPAALGDPEARCRPRRRGRTRTISQPPARAGPFTAAISGFGKSRVTMPAKLPLTAMSSARPCATPSGLRPPRRPRRRR